MTLNINIERWEQAREMACRCGGSDSLNRCLTRVIQYATPWFDHAKKAKEEADAHFDKYWNNGEEKDWSEYERYRECLDRYYTMYNGGDLVVTIGNDSIPYSFYWKITTQTDNKLVMNGGIIFGPQTADEEEIWKYIERVGTNNLWSIHT